MPRFLLSMMFLLGWLAGLEAAAPAIPKYDYRYVHDPDGIGKFYMGREIAWVMGHQAADWLDRPERLKEERTDKLLDLLPLKKGMVIADVGAGSGYFSFPIAERVGASGKVYAVDIQKEMVALIQQRIRVRGIKNVIPILGTTMDPLLPRDTVDLIFMVDVYHELSHPYEMTEAMVRALKPGGLLVFVEYRLEDPTVPIKLVHKMSKRQVIKEMSLHPLVYKRTIEDLPWQHVLIFSKKAE
ncbi:MAG: class I SAM-dependent methyltransferase [Gemmataceae bacterium]